ncbi:hypothetical protein HMPREF9137_1002 [Prevotella denticola F0289]|nr:hypothetical protein HMPREF9137_1002 [Prevotella denticola F0289]
MMEKPSPACKHIPLFGKAGKAPKQDFPKVRSSPLYNS